MIQRTTEDNFLSFLCRLVKADVHWLSGNIIPSSSELFACLTALLMILSVLIFVASFVLAILAWAPTSKTYCERIFCDNWSKKKKALIPLLLLLTGLVLGYLGRALSLYGTSSF